MSSKARFSAATERKAPPRKKPKKNQSPPTEPAWILTLPDDLLLNCLVRFSRLHHPVLSFVCKKFKSLLASPELYETRSLLNRTESCLYLRFRSKPKYWFTLCKNPKINVTSKSRGNILHRITPLNFPSEKPLDIVSIGSDFYQIGGHQYDSRLSVLDTKSHKWSSAPRMRVKRSFSKASVVDGKIYVALGSEDDDGDLKWVQVFDPKTQSWSSVKPPVIDEDGIRYGCVYGREFVSFGLEGRFYFFGDQSLVYDPKDNKWSPLGKDWLMCHVAFPSLHDDTRSYCVISDVLFFYDEGDFKWYDLKVSKWKKLNGLEGLPDIGKSRLAKMVDLGGKMAVLWFKFKDYFDKRSIWCAEISLERRDGDYEIWGKVEWSDEIAIVHSGCELSDVDVLSATV